jgi:nicotinate-nucleotide adenylyltransferase
VITYGVFGGTFDPPHIAHLILAGEAQFQLGLKKILWVLTPVPPHKPNQSITPVVVRQRLVEASIANNSGFEFSNVEIDRSPPHYAVDTMKILQDMNPDIELAYLMGEDSLRDLSKWYKPHEFIQRCAYLGVMHRPGVDIDLETLKRTLPGIATKIRYIEVPMLDVSSTIIRQRIASGGCFRYYLPDPVYQIIKSNDLYIE